MLNVNMAAWQLKIFEEEDFLTIKEASKLASAQLNKNISPANINYLINYGRLKKYNENGTTLVLKKELVDYYKSFNGKREFSYKDKIGEDLNWALSFDQYKEAETTKHVHRLHPYKGKFIPQLVEYFLDSHTDDFKNEIYFKPGDIVIDPFCGSGTTLVQANELGINAVGIDISAFNTFITNSKIDTYEISKVHSVAQSVTTDLRQFLADKNTLEFEERLLAELNIFNNKYFPRGEFKRNVLNGTIDEKTYGGKKEKLFLPIFQRLVNEYKIILKQEKDETFLDKWYLKHVRDEIDFVYDKILNVKDKKTRNLLKLILSRTIRSCRATTHADLATLVEPVTQTYFCRKHGKICKPLFSILRWWETYVKDTIERLSQFKKLRTDTHQICLTGDSREIDLFKELSKDNREFAALAKKQKINGIFSSPPYVGLIDYHEQHAYAYDLFEFQRQDELEIGPLFKGKGKEARESYIDGVSKVLINMKKYFAEDYNVLLVANDKFNMYPVIAEKAGMKIVNQFKRPVLNRTEKDKGAYSETIFHLKGKQDGYQ